MRALSCRLRWMTSEFHASAAPGGCQEFACAGAKVDEMMMLQGAYPIGFTGVRHVRVFQDLLAPARR
jgi:hypothetical protein